MSRETDKMITKGKLLWSLNKLSQPIPYGKVQMYVQCSSVSRGEFVCGYILGLIGSGGKLCLWLGEKSFLWFWSVGEQASGGGGRWGEVFGSSPS